MSQRFHTFRAPPRNLLRTPKRNSLPLPSVSSRKAATRFIRDVSFGIRSLSRIQLATAATTFAVVIFICWNSGLTDYHDSQQKWPPLRTTECACPVPRTPDLFTEQILNAAGFIAKVRRRNSVAGFLVLDILELYRGHSRAVQWPLLARDSVSIACVVDGGQTSRKSAGSEWLIIASGISSTPIDVMNSVSGSAKSENFSLLLPGKIKGPRCKSLVSQVADDRAAADAVVWMTPWDLLSAAVKENIIGDSGNAPLWWRTNDASLEFTNSLRRAVRSWDANSHTSVSGSSASATENSANSEWWLRDGVSVIAACKDRTETLQQAILSWRTADEVNEIVVVDWSSSRPISASLSDELLRDPRLVLVRVDGQSQWILSRAYNLAARSASFSRLMKVDCDTVLAADFFKAHEMNHDRFFAGDWRQLESGATNALHTNGLLYVNRVDFLAVGGFDERITTYGWDDSDIAERLAKIRDARTIANDKVQHISHSASLRVIHQPKNSVLPPNNPFAAAVEIQRNRLLLTRHNLPIWRANSFHVIWNLRPVNRSAAVSYQEEDKYQPSPVLINAQEAKGAPAASALVSDTDAEEAAKRAIRLVLRRLGLPLLPRTLTFNFYKTLIGKVANPDMYAEVVLSLRGGCISKLLTHVLSKGATNPVSLNPAASSVNEVYVPPPFPYKGWRLKELWLLSDTDCSCTFPTIFEATDEEVLSEWFDSANPIEKFQSRRSESPQQNITDILQTFSRNSVTKNISADVSKWFQGISPSKVLVAEAYCSTEPALLSKSERKHISRSLSALTPSSLILKGIHNSLAAKTMTVLDSPLLDIQKQSNLVSKLHADRIREALTSRESSAMLSKWTASSLSTDLTMTHSLDQRARAVMLTAFLAKHSWDKGKIPSSDSSRLEDSMHKLSQPIELLFQGCRASSYDYIESYPELAIIIAGLFSARLCLQ